MIVELPQYANEISNIYFIIFNYVKLLILHSSFIRSFDTYRETSE
jgi:hypothetical protein